MGSPLSAVLANLYMELLEKEHFLPILGENVTIYKYVDDMIAFIPVDVCVDDILRQLNGVVPHIQLTCEEEANDKLPFLDMVIRRPAHGLKFSECQKPTNKEDCIRYSLAHSMRMKTRVDIGLFLRTYRTCSPEFLHDELAYIKEAFMRLKFPESLLITLQEKKQRQKPK